MFDVNELLEEAIKETDNLEDEEIFLVKDLFKGYVWNRIELIDRLLLKISIYRLKYNKKGSKIFECIRYEIKRSFIFSSPYHNNCTDTEFYVNTS